MKHLGTFLRIVVGLGLLAFLFAQTDRQTLSEAIRETLTRWPWFAAGLLMTFLGLAVGAVRWGQILAMQGIEFPTLKILRIYFIGQFFNAFMLGACGGDVVRAYYAARGQEGRRAEAAMTILMDRAVGLFATILFCCLMIVLRIRIFLDNEGPRDTGILLLVFLLVSIVGLVVLFRKNVFEHVPIFQRLENASRIGPLIRRAYDAVYLYRSHPRVLARSLLLSVLNIFCLTQACHYFGQALAIDLPAVDYFTLFPIISVLIAVPLTPGSLGIREGLFVSLFRAVMLDKPHAILLSLTVYAGGLFWSLFGGLLYLTAGDMRPQAGKAPWDAGNDSLR